MKLSHFFIDRPRFATVISGLIIIFGAISYFSLPVDQYPQIAPPQVQVIASYPGANSETVAKTVATPLEQEINGVENMLYMSSQSTNDGAMSLSITFKPGTDINTAQVLVQNRVSAALPRLPEEVRRRGVVTVKTSPNILLAINLYSKGNSYPQNFIGTYAKIEISDKLSRLDGIGNARVFGASEYAMRLWLDPDHLSSLNLTSQDVLGAVRSQNIQVAGGALNKAPSPKQNAFEFIVETQGRLREIADFENIIVKSGENGALVRLKDVAKVELGSENYTTKGYLGEDSSVVVLLFMRPGANALETADLAKKEIEKISQNFPPNLEYKIVYNPTTYISDSIKEVLKTLLIAIFLVVFVVMIFLQSWRTAIIPVIAIPISLIGTFGLMLAFGYSLNTLSLFGLVLAIGIVVDDAIVVVENVERKLREGLSPVQSTKETMSEVGFALIATSLVLVAVFLPTVLMGGITGQFYKQFGVTIASATMISTLVSLTLSPAMAAILMRKPKDENPHGIFSKPAELFNNFMDGLSRRYGFFVGKVIRMGLIVSVVYFALIALAGFGFSKIPKGFIPEQDQGYTITALSLPAGASLERTEKVMKKVIAELLKIPDIKNTVGFAGFSGATFTNASNAGAIFSPLNPLGERRNIDEIIADMNARLFAIDEAFIITIKPPPVRGMGNAGGFKMMIQDQGGAGSAELEKAAWKLIGAANAAAETSRVYTFFETSTPRIYLDIDRDRALRLKVPLQNVFGTLEANLGSSYVNDFNLLGRTFRVSLQADSDHRMTPEDILRLRVRGSQGQMVPIGSIATISDISGPTRIPRYNLYPAIAVSGSTAPGFSSGQALDRMEQLAEELLPDGFGFEWTDLALQERSTGNTSIIIFCLAVLFVFLLLSAQYESWTLPLAIILIVPMCLLSAGAGLLITGMDNNILTQIGMIVLVGLASKNAILIVEFAKQNEDQNPAMGSFKAATRAAKVRLRPILMTAFSFIFGVIPLLFTSGAGFEMRKAIGTTVFSGMIGVTIFGLIFTPIFYVFCRKISKFSFSKKTQIKIKNAQ
ncbi:MAG: hydrophobe/amphiphile efflux-1 (HAE1) family protein [Myxococcota bacterium]|jgi:hydrophobe/amphiphile efflux-1 (HAE1) family protein